MVVTAAVVFTSSVDFDVAAAVRAAVAFSSSVDLDAAAALKRDAHVSFEVEASLRVRTLIKGTDYRLVVTDLAGNRYAELVAAQMGQPSWELNGPGGFDFRIGQDTPGLESIIPIEREVQVWKGDTLLWVGPVVRPLANAQEAAFQAATAEWYFSRRNFGKADRTNYVPFGDFEEGFVGGWSIGFSSPAEPAAGRSSTHWTGVISNERAVTGEHSLRLEQLASGQPKYGMSAGQSFLWEVDPDLVGEEGDVWSLVAYAYIPSVDWRGPNLPRYGLALSRFSTTETVMIAPEDGSGPAIEYPAPIEGVVASLDEYTPQDRWVRFQVSMAQEPTGEPEFVFVTLYAPDGAIFWDRVSLTLEEATRFEQTDQALIAAGIVEHLQDPAYGKSDLGIGTHTPLTGVLRDRTYLHQEHGRGIDALQEFPQLDDGLDWSVEVTPTEKTFTTHYPRKGRDLSRSLVLEYGRNIEDFTWGWDGEAAASSVIMLGTGDGSSREEGFAEDPALYGGITLEDVSVAPEVDVYSQIETLDNRAAERLRTVRNPTILEVKASEIVDFEGRRVRLLGTIGTGDLVGVRIHRGVVQIEAVYRIVRIALDTVSEVLTLTLNWWADNEVPQYLTWDGELLSWGGEVLAWGSET